MAYTMREVAINTQFGGFQLSHKAIVEYAKLKGLNLAWHADEIATKHYGEPTDPNNYKGMLHYSTGADIYDKDYFSPSDIPRDDTDLIKTIRKVGLKNSGTRYCTLKVVKIPDDVEWHIDEYDGSETIHEEHRSWS